MENTGTIACANCRRTNQEVPLIHLNYKGQDVFLCPQDLPLAIHKPEALIGKLPGAEQLSPYQE